MPVQDLTPQLRTRLSRVERVVGWFVIIATVLMLAGFGYYVYHVAESKGWTMTKAKYFTFVKTAAGLKEGDPVMLMGFPAGNITWIEAQPADDLYFNVYVEFEIREPYYGYIKTDSRVRVIANFLGSRYFDVTKGTNEGTKEIYKYDLKTFKLLEQLDKKTNYFAYSPTNKPPWVVSIESDAVNERLERLADQAEAALPNILNLTNHLTAVLSNTTRLTSRLDDTVRDLRPALENVTYLTQQLTNGPGAIGNLLIPTNLNTQLEETLASLQSTVQTANSTLTNANQSLDSVDAHLATLVTSLNLSLLNLANITSNLNTQVQTNDQILSQISSAIVSADQLMQGLKRHWLLRSAFKEKPTNAPGPGPRGPAWRSGKGR